MSDDKYCVYTRLVDTNTDYLEDMNGYIVLENSLGVRCKIPCKFLTLADYIDVLDLGNVEALSSEECDEYFDESIGKTNAIALDTQYIEVFDSDWIEDYNQLTLYHKFYHTNILIINAIVDEESNIVGWNDDSILTKYSLLVKAKEKFEQIARYNKKAMLSNSSKLLLLNNEITLVIDKEKDIVVPGLVENIESDIFDNSRIRVNSITFMNKSVQAELFMSGVVHKVILGKNTVKVGERAFEGAIGDFEVKILSDYIAFEKSAFKLSGVAKFDIESKTIRLGDDSFLGCTKLKEIQLNDVEYFGTHVFSYSSNIESIEFNGNIFEGAENLIFTGCDKLSNLRLPDNLSTINDKVLKGLKQLRKLYIPKSVKYIDDTAFKDISGCLITVPEHLKYGKLDKLLKNTTNKIIYY